MSTLRPGDHFRLRELDKVLNADVVKKAQARGTSPPWLKDFAGQLEDPQYVGLSLAERGFLKDLRLLALRRGNHLVFDETYLRSQLRLGARTNVAAKVARLVDLGFVEAAPSAPDAYAQGTLWGPSAHPRRAVDETAAHVAAHKAAANAANPSHLESEQGESRSRLEVELELEGPPNPPQQGGSEASPRKSRPSRARTQAPTPSATNGSGHGVAYIAGLIRNGVIGQMFELDEELAHAVVTDPEREQLRAQIRDVIVRDAGWRLPADELEHQLEQMGASEDELVGLLEAAADLRSVGG